jgi:hypothetical protein
VRIGTRRITRLRWGAVAIALALTGACGSSTSTTPTPTPTYVTETFSGTIQAGTAVYHAFTVTAQGTLTATLNTFSPQSGITMGFGIGQPSGTNCPLLSGAYLETAKVGSALQGTIGVGSYCVQLYDLGNMQGSDDYVITVAHP